MDDVTGTRTPAKPRFMVESLREQICTGHFPGDTRLPSIRSLMELYGMSYGSVKRGTDHLCRIGLAEKRGRTGIYVRRRREKPADSSLPTIALLVPKNDIQSSTGVYATVFTGINAAAESGGCSLHVHYVPVRDISVKTTKELSSQADGMILLAEYDAALHDVSLPIPVVGVCMHRAVCIGMSIVDIDPFSAAELALNYFTKRGIRTVSIVSDDLDMLTFRNRCSIFASHWTEAGGIVGSVMHGSDFDGIRPDTGYLFATSTILQRCSERVLKATGKTLSAQAAAIGIDGKNLLTPGYHDAAAITTDWQAVGAGAVSECLRRIKEPGCPPRRIYLQGRLVEGQGASECTRSVEQSAPQRVGV